MKRSPLARGSKPLRANLATIQAWQQRSRRRLPPMSEGRRAELPERAEVRRRVLERDRVCQLGARQTGHVCAGPLDVHERLPRGRGGDWLDEANCVALCRAAHSWVHEHPVEAVALGLLR